MLQNRAWQNLSETIHYPDIPTVKHNFVIGYDKAFVEHFGDKEFAEDIIDDLITTANAQPRGGT